MEVRHHERPPPGRSADQQTLLHLYKSLVRSKLDYGSVGCGSARESYLHILDPTQNHALRLCLGAFRTSPASSLCVQANEPPLYMRRKMLSFPQTRLIPEQFGLQYCLQPRTQGSSKPNHIPTLGFAPELEKIGFKAVTPL